MDDLVRFRRHDRVVRMPEESDVATKLHDWARFAVRVALLPAVIWGINLERRVSVLEVTRATAASTHATAETNLGVHGDLYVKLAGKADREDVPGAETLRRLSSLERRLERLEERR